MKKLVLFDMDGTLIDSDELVLFIYDQLTKTYPPIISFDTLDLGDVFAASYPDVIKELYGDFNQEHLDEIYKLNQTYKNKYLKLFQGVHELLDTLKKQDYLLGLVTSEMREIAISELESLGILEYFEHIVAFDDVSKPKPDPEGIINHLEFFNCSHEQTIYIGDQKSDGIASSNARVISVLMDWKLNKTIDYKNLFDYVACDSHELISIIKDVFDEKNKKR